MAAVVQVGQSRGSVPGVGAEAAMCPLPARAGLTTLGLEVEVRQGERLVVLKVVMWHLVSWALSSWVLFFCSCKHL